jgi:hypothetical protein
MSEIVLINYANDLFRKSQKINSRTGKEFDLFTKVISYHPNNIDADFRKKNIEILEQIRGNGYWLWKPYFIKKTLDDLNWGDFLFYCDSGSYFINSIQDLISLSQQKNQDVIPFELTHLEGEWTKRDAFVLMDCDSDKFYNTKQRLGGFVLIKKSELSMRFVEDWLAFAQDKRILADSENECGLENYPQFKGHRHDQSVFSLLTKKYDFTAYRDPSQYGNDLKKLYPDSNYEQLIVLNRVRNFPIYIRIKKYLQKKKLAFKKMFKKES